MRPLTAALALAATAVAGAGAGTALADSSSSGAPASAIQAPAARAVQGAGQHGSLADMVEAISPSVVQIDGKAQPQAVATPLGYVQRPGAASSGSGFIIDPSGIVITNNHVIQGADEVRIKLGDGSQRRATVLGRDIKTDIAVLRIEGGGKFSAVAWGDSDSIRVGDSVFAVGSPFGLGNSVTAGIVSARGREIGAGPYDDFLQVDAAINSGNSGGPLFNSSGEVVGVNTAIFSPNGGSVGIGFAIPGRVAMNIAKQIVEKGSVSRGQVGVALQDLNPELVEQLGLHESSGALIAHVEPNSPAAASGLLRGDVVRNLAGQRVKDGRDFARRVADATAGTSLPLTVVRGGRSVQLNLQIGKSEA